VRGKNARPTARPNDVQNDVQSGGQQFCLACPPEAVASWRRDSAEAAAQAGNKLPQIS